jgi:hypothetical protein
MELLLELSDAPLDELDSPEEDEELGTGPRLLPLLLELVKAET